MTSSEEAAGKMGREGEAAPDVVGERLRKLYPSCETDCTDGCRYGCLGWLHRFEPVARETPASD